MQYNIHGNGLLLMILFQNYSKAYFFVCTHLEAHDYNLDVRIRQYNQVVGDLEYKSRLQSKIFDHDYVVWMGDLNLGTQVRARTTTAVLAKFSTRSTAPTTY